MCGDALITHPRLSFEMYSKDMLTTYEKVTLSANLSLGLLTFQPLFFHFWLGLYTNKLCILKKRTWSIRMLPFMLTTLLLLAAALFPPVGGPNFDFYFFVQMVCIFIIEKKKPPQCLREPSTMEQTRCWLLMPAMGCLREDFSTLAWQLAITSI
jgi:hypothetical protein